MSLIVKIIVKSQLHYPSEKQVCLTVVEIAVSAEIDLLTNLLKHM